MRARPTVYKGVQYRSRLEATWAAFFELSEVKALYEFREDLEGYIPDFELVLPLTALPVIAEVKPALRLVDFALAMDKVVAGFEGHVVLLGACPEVCALTSVLGGKPDSFDRPLYWDAFVVTGATGTNWAAAQNLTQWRPVAAAKATLTDRYAGLR